jgi:hypothetical protein
LPSACGRWEGIRSWRVWLPGFFESRSLVSARTVTSYSPIVELDVGGAKPDAFGKLEPGEYLSGSEGDNTEGGGRGEDERRRGWEKRSGVCEEWAVKIREP